MTAQAQNLPNDSTLVSIGFLLDMSERLLWTCAGGHGPFEGAMAALVLALEPGCKTRRLLESLPAEKNMDRAAMLNAMANLGYAAEPVNIRLGDIEQRLLPCLFTAAHRSDAPFVVLAQHEGGLVVYNSLKHKITTLRRDRPALNTKGKAFFFLPYDRNADPASKFMRQGLRQNWFSAVVRRFSGTFWQILATCLALNLFALAPSLFIMAAYDRVISPADTAAMPALAAGVALALAAEAALRGIRSEGLAWMTARLDNIIGARIFSHLISLPAAMIEQASVAAQVARIKTFESVRDFFSSAVFLSFLEIPFVLIAIAVMAMIAGTLFIVPVAMIGAYAALFFVMRRKIMGEIRLAAKSSSARQQFVIETFEKLPAVRMNGLTSAWERKFDSLSGREILMNFHLSFLGTVAETLAHALTIIAAVLTVGYGVHLIWAGEMTTGALVASMILVWRILLPFYSLCTMIPRLEQLRNSIIQVNSLMELDTETDMAVTTAALTAVRGAITLSSVNMRYNEAGEAALKNLSFALPAGKIAAITGRNGSGKTSVLKLIKGLYRPDSGTVCIDGFDIRQMEAMELRRQIAYVPQNPDFFPGTLIENLIIGNPFAKMSDIENALKIADAWDEVKDYLSDSFKNLDIDTALAAKLSLARAYIQNAQLLLIDELPNAVMNGPAGQNLKAYLADGRGKKSAVVVTHRGDMLRLSDLIIQLEHNETPAVGSRDDMLKKIREAA